MNNEKIIREIKNIGFSEFVPLNKKKRDEKKRWFWTYPCEAKTEWFTVRLVHDSKEILIELLKNPKGKEFKEKEVESLITYIKSEIL